MTMSLIPGYQRIMPTRTNYSFNARGRQQGFENRGL